MTTHLERLENRVSIMTLEHTKYSTAFQGLTKEDVEYMLRFKAEKTDMDVLLKNMHG